jgi:hypothetical protein
VKRSHRRSAFAVCVTRKGWISFFCYIDVPTGCSRPLFAQQSTSSQSLSLLPTRPSSKMADTPQSPGGQRELDALYAQFQDKDENGGVAPKLSASVPLHARIHALWDRGNWPQAQVSDKIASEKVTMLTSSLETATDRRRHVPASGDIGGV